MTDTPVYGNIEGFVRAIVGPRDARVSESEYLLGIQDIVAKIESWTKSFAEQARTGKGHQ